MSNKATNLPKNDNDERHGSPTRAWLVVAEAASEQREALTFGEASRLCALVRTLGEALDEIAAADAEPWTWTSGDMAGRARVALASYRAAIGES